MLKHAWVVFGKEWRDARRDGRSLRLAFLPPLYFVLMFSAGILFALHMNKGGGIETSLNLPVSGMDAWPALSAFMAERGIVLEDAGEDPYQSVLEQRLDKVLILPPEAAASFAKGEPAELWLVYDASNPKLHSGLHRIRQAVQQWSQQQAGLRLLSRGVSPTLAQPVWLRESNVASEQKMGGYILGSLPMFLLMCVFIASVGFSADMTAGERERRSLESLLITPASSWAIMLGKWLTSVCLTSAVVLVFIAALIPALTYLPFNQLGVRVAISPWDYWRMFWLTLPVIFLAVSLQLLVAIFARSFKDAQTYIGLLILIPLLPFLYTLMNPGSFPEWSYWVPVLAQQGVLRDLLLGVGVEPLVQVKVWVSALFLAWGVLWLAQKQLRRARIVYG